MNIDPNNPDQIVHNGRVVATRLQDRGKSIVEISMSYTAGNDDWIVPLSWLAQGLARIEPPPPSPVMTFETVLDAVEPDAAFEVHLFEKTLKTGGYTWQFHKTDADPWPSQLHGHDYEYGLVLDGVTGDIFNVTSRNKVAHLKARDLAALQSDLRANKDLGAIAKKLVPAKGAGEPT